MIYCTIGLSCLLFLLHFPAFFIHPQGSDFIFSDYLPILFYWYFYMYSSHMELAQNESKTWNRLDSRFMRYISNYVAFMTNGKNKQPFCIAYYTYYVIVDQFEWHYVLFRTRYWKSPELRIAWAIRGTWYHPWVVPENERGSTRRKDIIRYPREIEDINCRDKSI